MKKKFILFAFLLFHLIQFSLQLFEPRLFFPAFFFSPFSALHLALLSDFLPLAYGGLLLLLWRRALWLFDCMETRFCSSVTDAANDWKESRGEERGGAEDSPKLEETK